ncbi:DMT family transporter [Clostridium oceanicum]|uniref:DMT family transporter n=1 Tax=Clostridium oceanicum TaxID=1543 RepID=A0ABP3USS1_9CLOT
MIKENNKKSMLADSSLLIVALMWGGGFVAVKDALDNVTPMYITAIRFIFASLILGIIFFKKLKNIRKKDLKASFIIALFLFGGFTTQTIGLQYTTAGKQAFLTAVYVVIIPFLVWFVDKNKPDYYDIGATLLAFAGIGFLTINKSFEFSMNFGDVLTLICAVLFAGHIVAVNHFAKGSKGLDPVVLSILQMAFVGIISLISGIIFEPKFVGISKNALFPVIYLVVFSTMLGFLIQNVAQKYTQPNHVGIILCLESVFGAVLSVIFLSDVFTINMVVGCIIIFIAIIISETKLEFIKSTGNKKAGNVIK